MPPGGRLGITSLPYEQADEARMLALVRGQWAIENRLHRVRDVTFDEDRSPGGASALTSPTSQLRYRRGVGILRPHRRQASLGRAF